MIETRRLRIGDKVEFHGGYYVIQEIRLFPELRPGGYWVTLEGYSNPVHQYEINKI
jgi:hypothetical protein